LATADFEENVMKKTAIVYSPKFLNHQIGRGHPESPRRLQTIIEGIKQSRLLEHGNCTFISPKPASLEDLKMVHGSKYVRHVKQLSESGGGIIDEETETKVSRQSYEVARLAAGGTIEAVHKVMVGEFGNAFVLARPPGHHAGTDYGMGFCIFNNVAIAAKYLVRNFGLSRVLILDIDSHHGNGTQEIFYGTQKVLYISLHEDPTEFPEAGFMDETGEGQGLGYTVNIPFPFGSGDAVYWKAVRTVVLPIMSQFKPQFVLVSAGFDGHYRDVVGELSLSSQIYPMIFQAVLDSAKNLCKGRVVSVLEGGYCLSVLRKVVPVVISQMAGQRIMLHGRTPPLDLNVQKHAEKSLKAVKRIQSGFWTL
jgi:acetoin utilization deacetylase AcuC-like enzyme